MKQDFRKLWKLRHAAKTNTRRDAIHYCILRAMSCKGEDKLAIAKHFIHKSFKPITNTNKLTNGKHPWWIFHPWNTSYRINNASTVLGVPAEELFEDGELAQFQSISGSLSDEALVRKYSYFFTRQDIFDEYQLVQTAHVALELGHELAKAGIDVKCLYFTNIGVKDEDELEDIEGVLQSMNLKYVVFREPDIGNEKTAIGVYPVAEHRRGLLRNYNLLKFNRTYGKEVW